MLITPNQTFLHVRDRYEAGREYDVPEADAVYFTRCGWVDAPPVTVPAVVDLDVHDATSAQEG